MLEGVKVEREAPEASGWEGFPVEGVGLRVCKITPRLPALVAACP